MRSRVHPKYKTKYRVSNWAEYDRALVQRGSITLWISEDAVASWKPAPTGLRGGQKKFSDHAIETALTLRLVVNLPLRQTEGFLRSVLSLMDVDLESPDHTTLSWRSQSFNHDLHRVAGDNLIHLIVDSTGLAIVGEGEWAAAKYGGRGRRGWKKLHLGVDRTGMIVAAILTDGNANDGKTALDLIDEVKCDITSITAARQRSWRSTCESKIRRDTAYDTLAIYTASAARSADVVVPPSRSATRSRQRRSRSSVRDRTIMRVKEIGRRQWKKEAGYHRQARVENTFFRYKAIVGPRLRARHPESQRAEAVIACNILNRMTGLGMPESFAVGA